MVTRFIQLHLLTFVPPSNLNRDDTGRPKTAIVGGSTRLRLSSQSLKRAWRKSDFFAIALEGHLGLRTKRIGEIALDHLVSGGMAEAKALLIAQKIASVFGAVAAEKAREKAKKDGDGEPTTPAEAKKKNGTGPTPRETTRTLQLAFISPDERAAVLAMADKAIAGEKIDPSAANLLQRTDTAADIALFGRMLADTRDYSRDAAVQVAHAITTHAVIVENDYFTAADDLAKPSDRTGAGAAHVGEAEFGSGVFYSYLCANRDQLIENLGGLDNVALANTALGALVRAAATVLPSGKQNSFAALSRASYVLAERGNGQPRTLAGAFQRPVIGADLLASSITALRSHRQRQAAVYGDDLTDFVELNVDADETATLAKVIAFCRGDA